MRATKVVFLHIPKCAGTSMRIGLKHRLNDERLYWVTRTSTPTLSQFISGQYWDEIAKYDFVGGHIGFKEARHIPGHKIYFSIIRDPVERTLSHFDFYGRSPTPDRQDRHPEIAKVIGLSFLEALDESPKMVTLLTNPQCKVLSGGPTCAGVVATTLRHPFVIDTMDNAQRVMKAMCETLGVETVKLPRKNAGPDGYAKDWATAEVIERIREMTQEDQKLFDLFNSA